MFHQQAKIVPEFPEVAASKSVLDCEMMGRQNLSH